MAYDKTKLSADALTSFLSAHPDWKVEGSYLVRTFAFDTFMEAVRYVGRVAGVAERFDHHPDMDVRYDKVTLRLTTHEAGGLTSRDPEVAAACESLEGFRLQR